MTPPLIPRRSQLIALAAVAAGLYFGLPRALIASAREIADVEAGATVDEVYTEAHRRLALLSGLEKLPGHRDKAESALVRVERAAQRRLIELEPKTEPQRRGALFDRMEALAAQVGDRSFYYRRLCKAGELQLLTLDAKLPESAYEARYALSALFALGRNTRAGVQLAQIVKSTRDRLGKGARSAYTYEEWIDHLLLAGHYRLAADLAKRGTAVVAKQKDGARHARELRAVRCAIQAARGKPETAEAVAEPRCLAARAWALARSGKKRAALAALSDLEQFDPRRRYLYVRFAVLAETGKWAGLTQLWHTIQRHDRSALRAHYGRRSALFNDIYNPPRAPSVLRTLRRRIEQRLVAVDHPRPELLELLAPLCFVRAQQLVLLGQPAAALRTLARARLLAPDHHPTQQLQIELMRLVHGPKRALELVRGLDREAQKTLWLPVADVALAAGQPKLAKASLERGSSCNGRYSNALCKLIRMKLAILRNDYAVLAAGDRELKHEEHTRISRPDLLLLARHRHPGVHVVDDLLKSSHISNVGRRAEAQLLFFDLVDARGPRVSARLDAQSCRLGTTSPDGHIFIAYLHRYLARTTGDDDARRAIDLRLRRIGRSYRNIAETMPNRLPD